MSILKIWDEGTQSYVPIPAIRGPQGPAGEKGEAYALTDADREEIVQAVLAALPSAEEVGY